MSIWFANSLLHSKKLFLVIWENVFCWETFLLFCHLKSSSFFCFFHELFFFVCGSRSWGHVRSKTLVRSRQLASFWTRILILIRSKRMFRPYSAFKFFVEWRDTSDVRHQAFLRKRGSKLNYGSRNEKWLISMLSE